MTDILTRDPNDSDEFPLGIGEQRTVILRRDTGEKTQLIDPRLIKAPSFDAIPRKVIEIDDTVTFRIPETIGCVDLEGPQPKPKPIPRPSVPPKYDMADAQPIAPWERVAGADDTQVHSILDSLAGVRADVDGELTGPQIPPTPDPVPPPPPPAPGRSPKGYVGRHRHPLDLIAEAGALPTWSDLGRIAVPEEPEPVGEAETASLPLLARLAVGTALVGAVWAGLVLAAVAVIR